MTPDPALVAAIQREMAEVLDLWLPATAAWPIRHVNDAALATLVASWIFEMRRRDLSEAREAIRLADECMTADTVAEPLLARWRTHPAVVAAQGGADGQ